MCACFFFLVVRACVVCVCWEGGIRRQRRKIPDRRILTDTQLPVRQILIKTDGHLPDRWILTERYTDTETETTTGRWLRQRQTTTGSWPRQTTTGHTDADWDNYRTDGHWLKQRQTTTRRWLRQRQTTTGSWDRQLPDRRTLTETERRTLTETDNCRTDGRLLRATDRRELTEKQTDRQRVLDVVSSLPAGYGRCDWWQEALNTVPAAIQKVKVATEQTRHFCILSHIVKPHHHHHHHPLCLQ